MKVLMIACSYRPDPVVGSFRASEGARSMRSARHEEVDVGTTRLSHLAAWAPADERYLHPGCSPSDLRFRRR
jgi:hypothetical protein